MQLTEKDYKDAKTSIGLISQITEDSKRPFIEWLKIVEFAASQVVLIFFIKGKPKNTIQLILSIPAIIKFGKTLLDMIKGEAHKKAPKRSLEQRAVDSIDKARTNSKVKPNKPE
jgi:hypothetical protein